MNAALFEGAEVQLGAMLAAREARMAAQHGLIKKHSLPVVSFTLNIPGPVKRFALADMLFDSGVDMINRALLSHGIAIADGITRRCETGCEYIAARDGDAYRAKAALTALEESFPAARLFDMDVITNEFEHISRADIGMQPRRCFLCSAPAAECARSRRHSLDELTDHVHTLLWQWYADAQAERIGRTAQRAMLYELAATPKPGLVDRRNSGSHKDMDVFTFMDSAAALYPYFEACARTGRETAEQPAPETFAALRPLGREAEGEMLDATGGVNTHKGAVFSVGIVCAALGRLDRSLWVDAARVLAEVSAMTAGLTEKDFAGVTAENAATVGQKLYIRYGITGVRGQVEAGLPAVLNVGLPVLEVGLAKGYDFDRVGGGALLAILANSTDTNIIARSSRERQLALTEELKALLAQTPYPDKDALAALDDRFIAENLSPGGSADLLALTWLLHFVTTEGNINE